jgi:hypothetical protein
MEKFDQIPEAIKLVIGHLPTDISPACCDSQNKWMIYIGLSGKTLNFNKKPNGNIRLPADAFHLYEEFWPVYQEGVLKGILAEDQSKGYALSEYPPARSIQLKTRSYALANEALLCNVLENSADDQHRMAAAQMLGYARQSESQIKTLVQAAKDQNGTVRNNAIRALWLLVVANPKLAKHIPIENIAECLQSGSWDDLNKGSLLLSAMTQSRDKKILQSLQWKDVLERVIEIARWKFYGHSEGARLILGRIAGIEEKSLQQLVSKGTAEEIIDKLPRK